MSRILICLPVILAAILLAAPTPAQAQTSRVYLASYFGLKTYPDSEYDDSASGTSGDIKFKNAWSFAGALGLRLSQQTRVELEVDYTSADLDGIDINGLGAFQMGGEITSWIGMLNAYYDFDVDWPLQPFLGAGLGLGHFDAQIDDVAGFATDTNDDALGLVWQVGGGLKYRMNPELAVTGGYRYLGTTSLEFGGYDLDYRTHEFRLGLEWDLPAGP